MPMNVVPWIQCIMTAHERRTSFRERRMHGLYDEYTRRQVCLAYGVYTKMQPIHDLYTKDPEFRDFVHRNLESGKQFEAVVKGFYDTVNKHHTVPNELKMCHIPPAVFWDDTHEPVNNESWDTELASSMNTNTRPVHRAKPHEK